MEALSLLVRDQRDAEGEEEEDAVFDSLETGGDRGLGAETGLGQRHRDPILPGGLEPRGIPSTSRHRHGHEPLQEIAPGGDELSVERSTLLRLESQREVRGYFEIPLDRLGCLHPDERSSFRNRRAEGREGFDDERPEGARVTHVGTASLTSPRTASFRSLMCSY
jgi:hypothetical protein